MTASTWFSLRPLALWEVVITCEDIQAAPWRDPSGEMLKGQLDSHVSEQSSNQVSQPWASLHTTAGLVDLLTTTSRETLSHNHSLQLLLSSWTIEKWRFHFPWLVWRESVVWSMEEGESEHSWKSVPGICQSVASTRFLSSVEEHFCPHCGSQWLWHLVTLGGVWRWGTVKLSAQALRTFTWVPPVNHKS